MFDRFYKADKAHTSGMGTGLGLALTKSLIELHRGQTSCLADAGEPMACQPLAAAGELGWWQPCGELGGLVAGTYLHGVFESGPWRRRWLNQLRARQGLPALSEAQPHHSRQRDALLDRLADAFEQHVDLTPLLKR